MAQPNNYMDILEDRYGFAPANSQEEVFAAQTIAEQLQDHGLATTTEEFSTPTWGEKAYAIPAIALFVGVFLMVFPAPARIVGFFILLISGALLAAWRFGYDFLAKIGPRSQSQNIIAVRRATNVPEDERPGRTVVVVAHYDTGREDLLSRPQISHLRGRLVQLAVFSVPVVGVLALIMLIPVIPDVMRYILFAIALLCSVPLLLWGINEIMLLFGPYTAGSVDNKTGVAAMLSVADRVVWGVPARQRPQRRDEDRYGDDAPGEGRDAARGEFAESAQPSGPQTIRRGPEVIRDLGILPQTCEIVYVGAPAQEPQPQLIAPEDSFSQNSDDRERPEDVYENSRNELPAEAYDDRRDVQRDDRREDQRDDRRDVQRDDRRNDRRDEREAEPQREPQRDYQDNYQDEYQDDYQQNYDEYDEYDDDDYVDDGYDDRDENWGKTDFDPSKGLNGHRSMLFDLPDPSVAESDPFASDEPAPAEDDRRRRRSSRASNPEDDFGAPDQVGAYDDRYKSDNFEVLGDDEISPVMDGTRREYKRAGGVLSHLFGGRRKKKEENESSMNDWLGLDDDFEPSSDGTRLDGWEYDNNNNRGNSWRGGATRNSKLRFVPGPEDEEITEDFFNAPYDDEPEDNKDEYADASSRVDDILADEEARAARASDVDENNGDNESPAEEYEEEDERREPDRELRQAITMMADEELAKHDVWFVALGASELGRAGMRDFVARHRSDLRGAFVINLSCVGSGNLSVVSDEGLNHHKKSDRRLVRTILRAAEALHVPIQRTSVVWGDTDALPAMLNSMRAATIMGCIHDGVPALSHTRDDIPDAVDQGMIADVVEVVCESIRQA